jgi:site-specific DNA recombinase
VRSTEGHPQKALGLVYLRLSSDPNGEADAVLNRQKPDCLAYCERAGIEVVEVVVENDVSASRYGRKKRVGYQRALEMIQAGEVNTVVTWHLDRLYRQVRELEGLISLVEEARGAVQIQTLSGEYDIMNADHRLTLRMMVSVAEKESDDKSRRLVRKHKQIADQGRFHGGGRGFGHACSNAKACELPGCFHDGRSAVPAEAAAIRWAAQQLLDGFSVKSVTRTWNEAAAVACLLGRHGVLTPRRPPRKAPDLNGLLAVRANLDEAKGPVGNLWQPQVVRRCLISPRIAGYREHLGALVRDAGGHPVQYMVPLLDPVTWERLKGLLTAPDRRAPLQVRRHPTGGLVFCGICKKRLVVGVTNKLPALKCQKDSVPGACGRVTVKLEPVLDLLRDGAIAKLLRAPDLLSAVEEPQEAPDVAHIRLEQLRQSLDQLDDNRFLHRRADGEPIVDQATYERMRAKLQDEIEAVSLSLVSVPSVPVIRGLPATAAGMLEAWNTRGAEWQRALLATVYERVEIKPAAHRGQRFTEDRVDPTWRRP